MARFEELFREYIGAQHAIALNSCTAALHLSTVVSGMGPGGEVITTPMTFCATANAIIHTGARRVFGDVDRATGNIDPDLVQAALTPRTKAVLPVHHAGRPCRMDRLEAVAQRHGCSSSRTPPTPSRRAFAVARFGTIGDLTCSSFYVTKNVVTGEGGMVTTNNPDFAARIKM